MNDLFSINQKIKTCIRCELCSTRTQAVPGRGNGNAEIVFIGEAPGANEDKEGKPFVGRSGKKLEKMMRLAGIAPGLVYITNIVKCRPPENRNPKTVEIATCSTKFLVNELRIIKPKIVVPVGTFAAQTILNRKDRIGELVGKHFRASIDGFDFDVFPTYHPAYVLRNPNEEDKVVNHLKAVVKFSQNS